MGFEPGARVRTRAQNTQGHTRLPHYLAARNGRIVDVLGNFRFADAAAKRGADAPAQMLYTVEFDAGDHVIHADLFESYLEREP